MFYEPGVSDHGLPHDPFKSCVIPRPIGWISTRDKDGRDNLAPFSQFTNLSFDPPMVMFSANQNSAGLRKDSVVNAEQTGVFGWSMATFALREAVNASAEELPHGMDEFERAGLDKLEAQKIPVSLVAASPVRFECRVIQTTRLPGRGTMGTVDVIMAEVIGVHIDAEALTPDGRIDVLKLRPIARMGYFDYTSVVEVFQMVIPGDGKLLVGLEGSVRDHSRMA